jgi:hypothetical protein
MGAMNKSYSFSITNKGNVDKNVCLFQGIIDTQAIAIDADENPVLTNGNVEALRKFGFSDVDAVLTDGVSPVFIQGKGLEIPNPNAEGAECIISRSSNPRFNIETLKSYLKSGGYLIEELIATSTTQAQFGNPITLQTISPVQSLTADYIEVTRFAKPTNFNVNKVVVPVSIALQADTYLSWVIKAGETVEITLVFTELQ